MIVSQCLEEWPHVHENHMQNTQGEYNVWLCVADRRLTHWAVCSIKTWLHQIDFCIVHFFFSPSYMYINHVSEATFKLSFCVPVEYIWTLLLWTFLDLWYMEIYSTTSQQSGNSVIKSCSQKMSVMFKANLLTFAYSFAGKTKCNYRLDCTWQLLDTAMRGSDWPDFCLGAGNLACSQSSLQGQACWEVGLGWEVAPACHTSNRLQRGTWA